MNTPDRFGRVAIPYACRVGCKSPGFCSHVGPEATGDTRKQTANIFFPYVEWYDSFSCSVERRVVTRVCYLCPDGLGALQRSRGDPQGVGKAADTKDKGDESALAAGPAFTPQSSVPTPAALTTAAGDSGSSAITGRGPRVPPQRMPNARRQSRITGSSHRRSNLHTHK